MQCHLKDYKCFVNDKNHAEKPLERTIKQIIRIRTPICLKEINHNCLHISSQHSHVRIDGKQNHIQSLQCSVLSCVTVAQQF